MPTTTAADVWRRCANDPVFFANTLLPKHPHPGQIKWLENSNQAINVLVPGNRWGKSTVIAMKHIWKCIFKKGLPKMSTTEWMRATYETISVAHSADQAEIVFKEARRLLSHPTMKPFVASYRTTPFPTIRFYNGAVMHCRSGHDGGKYVDTSVGCYASCLISGPESIDRFGTRDWWARQDSNLQPRDYESPALTIVLQAHIGESTEPQKYVAFRPSGRTRKIVSLL